MYTTVFLSLFLSLITSSYLANAFFKMQWNFKWFDSETFDSEKRPQRGADLLTFSLALTLTPADKIRFLFSLRKQDVTKILHV